jgi:hypothetical protein
MGDAAIVYEWGSAIAGREAMSLQVFDAVLRFYGRLKEAGEIEDFRVYLPSFGNRTERVGMMVVDGSAEQMGKLLQNEELQGLTIKAEQVAPNFTISRCECGPNVMRRIQQVVKARAELGIK